MEDVHFANVVPSSEMDLEDATQHDRPFSIGQTRRRSPNARMPDVDLSLLDDDIAMILGTSSPKRVASPRSDSDVEMLTSKPPRRKRRTLIGHRAATSAPQQQKNNPAPSQHRQRRKLIHRSSVASEDGLNDDIDMDTILKGGRAASRQGSVGSEASIGAAEDAAATAATDNKPKPSRRRRLRPKSAVVVPTTASWRNITQQGTVDIADDEDLSGTFRMGSVRGLGVGQGIADGASPIQPIILGTTDSIQHHPPTSFTSKRGRRRRQMRTEAMAEKLDRFTHHQDLVDLSQHLYIPSSVSSQQLAANSRNRKHPIVVEDDIDDDDDDEEVDDDVMVIDPDRHQEYHDDVNRVTPPPPSPKQPNKITDVASFSSPGLQEIEQQQVLRSEPVNTPITTDTLDVAQSIAVTQATVASEQNQEQATYIGRVIGSVSKFFLGY